LDKLEKAFRSGRAAGSLARGASSWAQLELDVRESPSLILAAAGDVRIMRFGMPRGGPRLARHLWRMCFALFIAAGSFFSVRARVAKILPDPFTTAPMRALPIVLLFGAMFYWLWRVRGRRPLPVLVRHDSREGSVAIENR